MFRMKCESSNFEGYGQPDDANRETRLRRGVRLGVTTVAAAVLLVGAFGGTEGTSDQPHDPNKNGVSPGRFPHPDAVERLDLPADPNALDHPIAAGPSDIPIIVRLPENLNAS